MKLSCPHCDQKELLFIYVAYIEKLPPNKDYYDNLPSDEKVLRYCYYGYKHKREYAYTLNTLIPVSDFAKFNAWACTNCKLFNTMEGIKHGNSYYPSTNEKMMGIL